MQALITEPAAAAGRALHPLRLQRSSMSSLNPWLAWLPAAADAVRAERVPASPDNPFLLAERAWADAVEAGFDRWRDARESAIENAFFLAWANPFAAWYATPRLPRRRRQRPGSFAELPEVQLALERIATGGYAEALVRMLVLIAATRPSGVRRSRLERSFSLLTTHEPLASMDATSRARLIHEQSLIVRFAPDRAFESLPALLPTTEERRRALDDVVWVVGDEREMEEATRGHLEELRALLELA